MSSQLSSFVPVLDGTNYQQWAASMQSYLMSQGQGKMTKHLALPPAVVTTTQGTEETGIYTTTTGQEELDKWNQDSEKALGNIRLRLHYTIGYQFNDETDPSDLWESLKNKYGKPGVTKAFVEFKSAMDTAIPNGSDPSPSLDKIMAHFIRLKEMKWDIPKNIQGMMILSKAPASMEAVVQVFAQMINEKSDAEKKELEPEKIINAMRTSWETHGRSGAGRGKQNQQQAQKLSAVKQNTGPPNFQQQQQQPQQQQRGDQDGRGRGRGRRGKRGGRKNNQQQLGANEAQQQQQPQDYSQVAGPSNYQQPPPPTQQWVPAPQPPVQ